MPKFVTIGYGDQAGYDRTTRAVRAAAHEHDERLLAGRSVRWALRPARAGAQSRRGGRGHHRRSVPALRPSARRVRDYRRPPPLRTRSASSPYPSCGRTWSVEVGRWTLSQTPPARSPAARRAVAVRERWDSMWPAFILEPAAAVSLVACAKRVSTASAGRRAHAAVVSGCGTGCERRRGGRTWRADSAQVRHRTRRRVSQALGLAHRFPNTCPHSRRFRRPREGDFPYAVELRARATRRRRFLGQRPTASIVPSPIRLPNPCALPSSGHCANAATRAAGAIATGFRGPADCHEVDTTKAKDIPAPVLLSRHRLIPVNQRPTSTNAPHESKILRARDLAIAGPVRSDTLCRISRKGAGRSAKREHGIAAALPSRGSMGRHANRSPIATLDEGRLLSSAASSRRRLSLVGAHPYRWSVFAQPRSSSCAVCGRAGSRRSVRFFPAPVAAKVPEVILLFWVVKILTTAGGEATSDYLRTYRQLQGRRRRGARDRRRAAPAVRHPSISSVRLLVPAYAIAITGTGVSDFLHLDVHIPYAGTTLLWAVILAAIFWVWQRSEGTLSIHSITTQRREASTGQRCSRPSRSARRSATSRRPRSTWGTSLGHPLRQSSS